MIHSNFAMYMLKKSAGTALPNSIAAAAVQQMLTTATRISTSHTRSAVNCREKRVECAIMLQAAYAEDENS